MKRLTVSKFRNLLEKLSDTAVLHMYDDEIAIMLFANEVENVTRADIVGMILDCNDASASVLTCRDDNQQSWDDILDLYMW